jgi:hypothetical protein
MLETSFQFIPFFSNASFLPYTLSPVFSENPNLALSYQPSLVTRRGLIELFQVFV